MNSSDLVIVGGGVIGLSVAHQAAKAGLSVTVYDQGGDQPSGSAASAGLLAPHYENSEPGPLFDFALRSGNLVSGFIEELQGDSQLELSWSPTGSLALALSRGERFALEERLAWQKAAGYPLEWVSPAVAQSLEPSLSPRIEAALFLKGDHFVDARRMMTALRAACITRGVRLRDGVRVEATVIEKNILRGLRVGSEFHAAGRALLAAGSWSARVETGAPEVSGFMVKTPGQMAALKLPPGLVLSHVVRGGGVFILPRPEGLVWVGSSAPQAGLAAQVSAQGLTALLGPAIQLIPRLAQAQFVGAWAGEHARSFDGLPVLGETAVSGLYVATGHDRMGFLLAPLTARIILGLVQGVQPEFNIEPFSPRRFRHSEEAAPRGPRVRSPNS